MENISIKEIKETTNLFLFNTKGIGLRELQLSNEIFKILEDLEKTINAQTA